MTVDLPPESQPGKLGDRVERTLVRFLLRVYNKTIGPLGDRLREGVSSYLERIESELAEHGRTAFDAVLENDAIPNEYREYIRSIAYPQGQGVVIIVAAALIAFARALFPAAIAGVSSRLAQASYNLVRPEIPDVLTTIRMYALGVISGDELRDFLGRNGVPDDMLKAYETAYAPKLSPPDLFTMVRRFGLPESEAVEYLGGLGYSDADIDRIRALTTFTPGPGDLVRFAVREAWRDDVAQRWGYDEDYPPDFGREMERLGDREGWARRFWRAHWTLPGNTTVVEALHRGYISRADYAEYLRTADIPSTWRDIMGNVAYLPYTRVDVRRMHQLGVLSDEELVSAYMDGGYDEQHARNLAEFTIKANLEELKEATRTDVLRGVREGMVTPTEGTQWLESIGYAPDDAAFLVALELSKIARELVDEQIAVLEQQYIYGEITESEGSAALAGLDLSANEIRVKLERWRFKREAKVRRPTRADLERFVREDVIDLGQFEDALSELGYLDRYIPWYLESLLQRKAEERQDQEKKQLEEAERTRTREITDQYRTQKAALDLDIAELRTAIAETQLALQTVRNEYRQTIERIETAATVGQLQDAADNDIALLRVRIEQLETDNAQLAAAIATRNETAAIYRLQSATKDIELTRAEAARIINERQVQIDALREEIEAAETVRVQVGSYVYQNVLQLDEGASIWIAELLNILDDLGIPTIGDLRADLDAAIDEPRDGYLGYSREATQRLLAGFALAIEGLQDQIAALQTGIDEIRGKALIQAEVLTDAERDRLVAELETQNAGDRASIAANRTEIETLQTAIAERRAILAQAIVEREGMNALGDVIVTYHDREAALTEKLRELEVNVRQLLQAKALLDVGYRQAQAG